MCGCLAGMDKKKLSTNDGRGLETPFSEDVVP